MARTECNCDLPLFAYIDWLQEQGWSTEEIEEAYEFVTGSMVEYLMIDEDGNLCWHIDHYRPWIEGYTIESEAADDVYGDGGGDGEGQFCGAGWGYTSTGSYG
jgi:hypothetical protein